MSKKEAEYPECEKLSKIHSEIIAITQFMGWLSSKKIILGEAVEVAKDEPHDFYPCNKRISDLLNEYFNIDAAKLEQERRAMLDKLRKEQGMAI